jgi:FKBP-type peptidyl-prolyl cis-trans isomerase FkpA
VTVRSSQASAHVRRIASGKFLRSLILSAALAVAVLALTACSSGSQSTAPTTTSAPAETQAATPSATPTESATPSTSAETVTDLQIKDTVVGKGAVAKAGDKATVDYTGWLMDGTKFDSSVGKTPFSFVLGGGQVIEGWDKGVVGMKVGGTRQLIIPSAMGYGPQGFAPAIPPNATLKFEVKLLSVGPATP